MGLLVLKDGRVVLERYAGGNTAQTKWISFSIAKSVTSLLYGAAIRDRHIKTLDDQVIKYVPELAGTAYDGVTLRHLLQMSSGVAWNDDPRNRESDVAKLTQIDREGGLKALLAYMGRLPRAAAPGTRFNYNTAETDLAGAVLRSATGRSLSEYLSEKIWKPFGMQSDAHWVKMRSGDLERGGCCISATLRDYGRIGLFALSNGTTRNGTRILPAHWMEESTRPASTNPGYGYYWWLRRNGGYHASGIFGQHIEVNPKERVVVALQSYWTVAFNDELTGHHDAFIEAVTAAVRDARPGR
ncbi:MAG: serine hydrolase domain-containing protein [Pyrinomonadaceae bacterium]